MRTKTKLATFAVLLGTAVAIPAIAQTTTVSQYPACPDPPPKVSQADGDAAHVVFLAGQVASKEGDYGKAIDSFKDAYRRDCSKTVLLRFIALAYEAKGDKVEAVNAFETYLKRDPKADDAESVRRHIDNLKQQIAAQPTATATATTTATTTATAPTSTGTVTPPPERGHTAGPWVVVGTGAAVTVAGVVLLIVGQGKVATSKDCSTGKNNICYDTDVINGTTRRSINDSGTLLSNVGVGVGIGGLAIVVGGLLWHFLEPTGPVKTEGKVRLNPDVGPGYAGLTLGGSF